MYVSTQINIKCILKMVILERKTNINILFTKILFFRFLKMENADKRLMSGTVGNCKTVGKVIR